MTQSPGHENEPIPSGEGGELMECTSCGEYLTEVEVEDERNHPSEGEHLCDDCYHGEYEFSCSYCEKYFPRDPNRYIVVDEDGSGYVGPGFYEVTNPICWRGGALIPDRVRKLADIDPGRFEFWGEAEGHICPDCATKLLGEKGGE